MGGDTLLKLFGWTPEVCCAKPANSKFTSAGVGCAWQCDGGFTRNLVSTAFAPYDPGWSCHTCDLCPSGQYVSKPCTRAAQTVCSVCRACSVDSGLADGGGCVGQQDRACVRFFTHSGYPELAKDVPARVTYYASRLPFSEAGANSVTIRPVSDTGGLAFTPAAITLKANELLGRAKNIPLMFAVVAKKSGGHIVRLAVTGDIACPCRPEPAGEVCRPGCPEGSGFLAVEPELVMVFDANHRTVFERLNIPVGTLPAGVFNRSMGGVVGDVASFIFSSTEEWRDRWPALSAGGAAALHTQSSSIATGAADAVALLATSVDATGTKLTAQLGVLKGLEAELAGALRARDSEAVASAAASIRDLYACPNPGNPASCWPSDPVHAKAVAKLKDVVALAQLAAKDQITDSQAQSITAGAGAAVQIFATSVTDAKAELVAELDVAKGLKEKMIAALQAKDYGGVMAAAQSIQSVLSCTEPRVPKFCWSADPKFAQTLAKIKAVADLVRNAGTATGNGSGSGSGSGNGTRALTCGVVHARLGNRALPISVAGGNTTLGQGFAAFSAIASTSGACSSDASPFFSGDVLDYVQSGALGKGVLSRLSLPKWLNLADAGIPSAKFSASDPFVRVVKGSDMWRVKGCAGLPVEGDISYHVLQIPRAVTLAVEGIPVRLKSVRLDTGAASQVCLLLDMTTEGGCSKSGGGVSFMLQLPEAVWSAVSSLPMFQQLAKQGLAITSGRLGIGGKIEAFPGKKPHFWNGAEHFEHGDSTKYNFYVGGTAVQTVGDTKLTIDGNFFMAVPGLCGDFRGVFGSGAWSAAVRASVSLESTMMGGPLELAMAEAKMLLTFGGPNKREVCTKRGNNPSGVFFNGRLKTSNPFKGNIVGSFFPSLEADVDVYLLASYNLQAVTHTTE